MTDASRATSGLAELLGERALRSGTTRLAADIVIGALAMGLAAWLRPAGWVMFAGAGTCLAAYGVWAFAVRQLSAQAWRLSPTAEQGWQVLRAAGAVVGLAAFVLLLLSLLGAVLGTWIS